MFIKKAFYALAVVMVLMSYSCGNSVPQKTNVLVKKKTPNKNTASKNQPQKNNSSQPKQTVFAKPVQITKKSNNEEPVKTEPKPKMPVVEFESSNANTNSGNLAYRSSEYYAFKADSLQQLYSRSIYSKNIQTIIDQISEIPSPTNNPAVNSSNWYAAIDFNIRKPNFVVLHHTAQPNAEQTLFTFSLKRSNESSAHYVVGRDGTVYQMLNDYVRSYHAGAGKWGNITDMNSSSLGIEIDNTGNEPYSNVQIEALIKLLGVLKNKYNIPTSNFIAHSDVAPGRKQDPSKYFPWKMLADKGFGYWYDAYNLATPPADFNAIMALRIIGYDISNPADAIGSFKLHYIQNDSSKSLTEYDKKVLYSIFRRY